MSIEGHIVWDNRGNADLVSLTNDEVVVRSTVPSPPGSRIEGALSADASVRVRFKVHSSKKQADNTFILSGRPLDLLTATKEKLLALLSTSTPTPNKT